MTNFVVNIIINNNCNVYVLEFEYVLYRYVDMKNVHVHGTFMKQYISWLFGHILD